MVRDELNAPVLEYAMRAAQEKMPQPPPPFSFAPFEKAIMESIEEGIVVFDSFGRLVYANRSARRLVEGMDELATARPEVLRRRLSTLGGRSKRLQIGGSLLGDAVILPASENDSGAGGGVGGGGGGGGGEGTLAERERRATTEMLKATGGSLAAARHQSDDPVASPPGVRTPPLSRDPLGVSFPGHARPVRHRRVCPLVRCGLRGHHFLRVLRPVLRDRRDGAVPLVRPGLRAGVRPLRHLAAAQSGAQRVLLACAAGRPSAGGRLRRSDRHQIHDAQLRRPAERLRPAGRRRMDGAGVRGSRQAAAQSAAGGADSGARSSHAHLRGRPCGAGSGDAVSRASMLLGLAMAGCGAASGDGEGGVIARVQYTPRDSIRFVTSASLRRCGGGRGFLLEGEVQGNGALVWLRPGDSIPKGRYRIIQRGDTST